MNRSLRIASQTETMGETKNAVRPLGDKILRHMKERRQPSTGQVQPVPVLLGATWGSGSH